MELEDLLHTRAEDVLSRHSKVLPSALSGIKNALDPVTPQFSVLDQIHVDGLAAEQVWVQAQMVTDGALREIMNRIKSILPTEESEVNSEDVSDSESAVESHTEVMEEDSDEEDLEDEGEFEGFENNVDQSYSTKEDKQDSDFSNDFEASDDMDLSEDNETGHGHTLTGTSTLPKTAEIQELEKDGFDLAAYQQQVLALEQAGKSESESEEEIDWNAPPQDSESDADLHYDDFFAQPTKKPRVRFAERSDGTPDDSAGENSAAEENDNFAYAEDAVRRDLFDSEEDGDSDGTENLSKFEKQQREMEAQIRELEKESMAVKEWGMKGEVRAAERPSDSLVNAPVEFERGAKPVPVVTEDATREIEDLIRERVRKQQWDDIPRRLAEPPKAPSRELPEVQQTKSQKSLAELYEEDHQRSANPDYFRQEASAKLDGVHKEIADAYNALARKLDALSSWTYTPRAPEPSLEIRTDAPSISMEESQPSTMAGERAMAPHEIYKPGDEAFASRTEMATSEKRRRRRLRAKEAGKHKEEKSGGKTGLVETLRRGNVTLVDKQGRKRDMQGNKVESKHPIQATHIKL